MGIIETWTLIAVILHFCDVKYFANLTLIDWPWHWSCLCLFEWAAMFYVGIFILYIVLKMK